MMKNSKLRRILLLLACAVLLVSLSVGATLAYLTSTAEVENTFTVGDVKIKLDEAKVDTETGKAPDPEDRTPDGNKQVRMVPGRTIDKDPTVTVLANSEDCYVRVKVTVSVSKDKWPVLEEGDTFATWAASFASDYILNDRTTKGFNTDYWTVGGPDVKVDDRTITYTLTYKIGTDNIVAKATTDTALPTIFDNVYVPAELGNAELAKLAGMKINVVAEAIQAEGFTASDGKTAEMKAWEAFDNPN